MYSGRLPLSPWDVIMRMHCNAATGEPNHTAKSNMLTEFGEVRTGGSRNMAANRQTDRHKYKHANRNTELTSLPYGRGTE